MTPDEPEDDEKSDKGIKGIFEGLGGGSAGSGDTVDEGDDWAPPTAAPVAASGAPPAAAPVAPRAGPPEPPRPGAPPAPHAAPATKAGDAGEAKGEKHVMDIFDFSRSKDRIPPTKPAGAPPAAPGGGGVPMAVPMAAPFKPAEKKKVEPAETASGIKKEKLPSVEELTALADEAYDNYNFIDASRHIKNAMVADSSFPPARELYTRLCNEHPNLFEDTGGLAGYGLDHEDEGPLTPEQLVRRKSLEEGGARDKARMHDIKVEKRDIGEKGLVKTRSGRLEDTVRARPKTLAEQMQAGEKKGYRVDKKNFMATKGGLVGLLMGVVAIGIIVFALWYTGMIEF